MTVDDVKVGLARIGDHAADDESAHGLEDELRARVLEAIAAGAPNAAELAREVLRSAEIQFSRWCA